MNLEGHRKAGGGTGSSTARAKMPPRRRRFARIRLRTGRHCSPHAATAAGRRRKETEIPSESSSKHQRGRSERGAREQIVTVVQSEIVRQRPSPKCWREPSDRDDAKRFGLLGVGGMPRCSVRAFEAGARALAYLARAVSRTRRPSVHNLIVEDEFVVLVDEMWILRHKQNLGISCFRGGVPGKTGARRRVPQAPRACRRLRAERACCRRTLRSRFSRISSRLGEPCRCWSATRSAHAHEP